VTKTTTERVAQNFVFPETTHLVISPVMKMGTKCVWLAGEENIVKQLSVKQVVIQFMALAVFLENARARLAGTGNSVTSASCFLGVFMELAVNHGSVTASLNGEDCFVIKISTDAE